MDGCTSIVRKTRIRKTKRERKRKTMKNGEVNSPN